MRSDWTPEELDQLRSLYRSGPTAELARQMGRSENALRIKARKIGLYKPRVRVLHSEKYWTSGDIQMLQEFYPATPTKEIAQRLGRPVKGIRLKAHKLGIKKIGHPGFEYPDHLRRYTVMDNLFQELTPTTAYVLGFILADGNIYQGRLKIAIVDYDILDKMRQVLQASHPIVERHKQSHVIWELIIIHKATVQNLIARGITPRKSLTATLPDVPDHLFSHFIRGYFDGDGAVRYTHHGGLQVKFTSGSLSLLRQMSERLHLLYGLPKQPVACDKGHQSAGRLYYSGPTAARLGAIMYESAQDLYLARKHQVFQDYATRPH